MNLQKFIVTISNNEGYKIYTSFETNSYIDLIAEKDNQTILFEFKTNIHTTSIDRAIGQLLRYKFKRIKKQQKCDKLILASIGKPSVEIMDLLKELQIEYRDLSFISMNIVKDQSKRRSHVLSERKKCIIKSFLHNGDKLEGFGVLRKELRENPKMFVYCQDDLDLIQKFLKEATKQ